MRGALGDTERARAT